MRVWAAEPRVTATVERGCRVIGGCMARLNAVSAVRRGLRPAAISIAVQHVSRPNRKHARRPMVLDLATRAESPAQSSSAVIAIG